MSGGESAEARAGMRKRKGSGRRVWSLISAQAAQGWSIGVCGMAYVCLSVCV